MLGNIIKHKGYQNTNAFKRFDFLFYIFRVESLEDIPLWRMEDEKDKDYLLLQIKQEWSLYYYLNPELQNIKEFFMAAINENHGNYKIACEFYPKSGNAILDDEEVFTKVVSLKGEKIKYNKYKSFYIKKYEEKDIDTSIIKGYALKYASKRLRNLDHILDMVVPKDGNLLKYGSKKQRNRKDLALLALDNGGDIVKYLSAKLLDDEEVILKGININSESIAYASKRIQDKEFFINIAILDKPENIQYASERLRDSDSIAEKVLKMNVEVFKFLSDRIRDNEEIVFNVLSKSIYLSTFMSSRLKQDINFLAKLVKLNSYIYDELPTKYADEKLIVFALMNNDGNHFIKLSPYYKNNREVFLLALNNRGSKLLKEAGGYIKSNKELVLEAIKRDYLNIAYIPKFLISDKNIIDVVTQYGFEKILENYMDSRSREDIIEIKNQIGMNLPNKVNFKSNANDFPEEYRIENIMKSKKKEVSNEELIESFFDFDNVEGF